MPFGDLQLLRRQPAAPQELLGLPPVGRPKPPKSEAPNRVPTPVDSPGTSLTTPESQVYLSRVLTDLRDDDLGPRLLAEVRKQEEEPRQAFLAGVEELVNQVRFDPDVAR